MSGQGRRHSANIRLRELALPFALAVATLSLYLAFRSISLDDFDSYSFALALSDFDIALQQPQPPGFPIYVAMGRALLALMGDSIRALTTLSAISGVVSVLLVYGLGRELDPRHPRMGVWAALLFALIPVSWLTGEKALSDVPGLMWTLLALWQWTRWRNGRTKTPISTLAASSGLITGLALGVRPQNFLPILIFAGYALIHDLARRRPLTPWMLAAATGTVGVLLWLVPTTAASGGLEGYLRSLQSHSSHVGRADSLFGLDMPLGQALLGRGLAFLDALLSGLAGDSLYQPHGLGTLWRIPTLAGLTSLGLIMADWRRRATRWLAIWAVTAAAQVYLFENLDRPRLLLPVMPPVALLIASGLARFGQRRHLGDGVAVVAVLLLLTWTTPLAAQLSQIPAPPAQAASYIAEHYATEDTFIAAAGSFRAAQVELPQYPLVYLYRFDPDAVAAARQQGRHYVAILDRDHFTPEAIEVLSNHGEWVTVEDLTFRRDRQVHSQHDQVRLQILAPPGLVPLNALSPPTDGCIDIGDENDGRYLGQGWFRPEEIGGVQARWAGQILTTTVRLHLEAADGYRLRLRAMAYPESQKVSIRVNGIQVPTLEMPQAWTELEVQLPGQSFSGQEITRLELVHSAAESPFESTGGASSDARILSAAYDWICLSKAGAGGGGN